MSEKKQQPKCMTVECEKVAKWRGLCSSCYGQAKHLIDSKQVADWEELEQMGLVEVQGKPFLKAFKLKKLEQGIEKR